MSIKKADSAGFCFGVNRAINIVNELLEKGIKVATLGPIIHNMEMVHELEERGCTPVKAVDELTDDTTLVIRSHGVEKSVIDSLVKRGINFEDATCPFVKKIHKIVSNTNPENDVVLIAGNKNHPEVCGIIGHCASDCYTFNNEAELDDLLPNILKENNKQVQIVAQTTFDTQEWKKCVKKIKKLCTNAKIFDTICFATRKRQAEAAEIAARADAMVVVGDRRSANTQHLAEICRQNCSRVLQIESADELSTAEFAGCRVAGLTAGASTPAGIIKEVKTTMSEEIKSTEGMEESFEELLNQSFKTLNTGEKVTGSVTAITPTEVQVDVGAKQYAYIKLSELSDDPSAKPEDIVKVGDEVETYVVRVNDVEGYAELSKKRLDAVKIWENIETAVEEKTVLEGTVTEENKGGIVVSVKGIRVFVPASQSGQPRGADLSAMKGQKVQLRITEVNRARRRVVGSIRSVTDEARKAAQEAVWSTIEVGKHYTGTVKSMTSYGVFVDIGGVDGMVHISELSWSRIKNPAEICKVGDTMDVYVISFDAEKHKISLGAKDHSVDPWQVFMNKYGVGDTAEVRIVKLMPFGAFAEVVPGVDGLIHISQIADRRIEKPEDVLSEGQTVEAKITAIDEEKQKISLSIRALLAPAADEEDAPVEE